MQLSRRLFVVGAPLALAGCGSMEIVPPPVDPALVAMYGEVIGEPYPIPAVDVRTMNPALARQQVQYATNEPVGTIVVDPENRFLYLVQAGGTAMRYGVGVGKVEAFDFDGEAVIARKAEWPGWRPTDDMIARDPERYGPVADGLPGGLGNPLGARALYLYQGGRDTYYRLHGTNEPASIGLRVSSGCVRLFNQDIIDLYNRTPVGTRVVVLPSSATA